MKILKINIILILLLTTLLPCQAQKSTPSTQKNASVQVYYFHFTRRCATCNAVEAETKKSLETLYPQHMKSGEITFQSVNLDEAEGEAIGKKVGVSEQMLVVIKGSKRTDLTDKAFLLARTKPEKLRKEIQKAVDKP